MCNQDYTTCWQTGKKSMIYKMTKDRSKQKLIWGQVHLWPYLLLPLVWEARNGVSRPLYILQCPWLPEQFLKTSPHESLNIQTKGWNNPNESNWPQRFSRCFEHVFSWGARGQRKEYWRFIFPSKTVRYIKQNKMVLKVVQRLHE